jgi:hypothetical protein
MGASVQVTLSLSLTCLNICKVGIIGGTDMTCAVMIEPGGMICITMLMKTRTDIEALLRANYEIWEVVMLATQL